MCGILAIMAQGEHRMDVGNIDWIVEEWMTTRELSEHLGVHELTILRWKKEGKGPPYYKIGTRFRYLKKDVEKWVSEQQNS
jgi:excisionase family DNA binding protein